MQCSSLLERPEQTKYDYVIIFRRVQKMSKERVPYRELDPAVVPLVRVLNRFPAICTYTSCGGHPNPQYGSQAEQGTWYVDFHVDRTDEGWISLEFFAWLNAGLVPEGIYLTAGAHAPYLNQPGEMIYFRWTGQDPDDPECTPEAFATLLKQARHDYYVTAARAARWAEYNDDE
jgi:hypothetical protein